MTVTPEESRRLHVLSLVDRAKITVAQATEALGRSRRQLFRLLGKLRTGGPSALAHGNRGRPPANVLPPALGQRIVALARGRYAGLNAIHLPEKLTAVEGLTVSRATVQRWLRAAGVASPRRRPRQPQAGRLVLLDGSPCAWFGDQGPDCTLVGAIDDATGEVPAAGFRAEEDAAGSLWLLRELGRTVGLPVAVYTDRPGIFRRTDKHWTLPEELAGAQAPTQVGRALHALGIQPIQARRPQAKGRIERLGGRSRTGWWRSGG